VPAPRVAMGQFRAFSGAGRPAPDYRAAAPVIHFSTSSTPLIPAPAKAQRAAQAGPALRGTAGVTTKNLYLRFAPEPGAGARGESGPPRAAKGSGDRSRNRGSRTLGARGEVRHYKKYSKIVRNGQQKARLAEAPEGGSDFGPGQGGGGDPLKARQRGGLCWGGRKGDPLSEGKRKEGWGGDGKKAQGPARGPAGNGGGGGGKPRATCAAGLEGLEGPDPSATPVHARVCVWGERKSSRGPPQVPGCAPLLREQGQFHLSASTTRVMGPPRPQEGGGGRRKAGLARKTTRKNKGRWGRSHHHWPPALERAVFAEGARRRNRAPKKAEAYEQRKPPGLDLPGRGTGEPVAREFIDAFVMVFFP